MQLFFNWFPKTIKKLKEDLRKNVTYRITCHACGNSFEMVFINGFSPYKYSFECLHEDCLCEIPAV